MPVAVRQAVSTPMIVYMLSGKESKKPGNCTSNLNSGDGIMRASAKTSNTVDVTKPIRFESGVYFSCSTMRGLYLSQR
jgi:hypothetical protein